MRGAADPSGYGEREWEPLVDPLFLDRVAIPSAVTEIQWSQEDALPFPVCISSHYLDSNGDPQPVTDVSVVYGNVVLADQGLSFTGISLAERCPRRAVLSREPGRQPLPAGSAHSVAGAFPARRSRHRPRHSSHPGSFRCRWQAIR